MENVAQILATFEGKEYRLDRYQMMNLVFMIQENMDRTEIYDHNDAMGSYFRGKVIGMGEMIKNMGMMNDFAKVWVRFREDQGKSTDLPWKGWIQL